MAKAKRRIRHADDGSELETGIENGEEGMEEMEQVAEEAGDAGERLLHRMQHSAFNPFELFGAPAARLMNQNWSMFHRTIHAMQEESLHFMNRRLEHTSQAIESSRDCGGVSDLLAIQQEWVANFARDYAEQTKRFAELVRELAEDGTSNLTHATSEVAERGRHAGEEESRRAAA